jgi:hypothetical protein
VINAAGTDGKPPPTDVDWCRDTFRALQPHATGGVYVNFLDTDEGQERVRAAYGQRRLAKAQVGGPSSARLRVVWEGSSQR